MSMSVIVQHVHPLDEESLHHTPLVLTSKLLLALLEALKKTKRENPYFGVLRQWQLDCLQSHTKW